MAEEKKAEVVLSVEAKALDVASDLVRTAYWQSVSAGANFGPRWNGVDTNDRAAVDTRLCELADLIADLKQRMLK